jgi:hypothetical protein
MRFVFRPTCTLAVAGILGVGLPSALAAQYSSARPVRSAATEPRFEIAVFGGWQFGGNWDAVVGTTPGQLDIADDVNYGMSFAMRARPGVLAEFLYIRQPTTLYFNPAVGAKSELFPIQIAYYQLGGMYEIPKGRIRPFGSLSAGITYFNPKQSGVPGEVRFSMAAGVGVRAFLTERIGVRGQFHMLIPIQWGSVYCGPYGCGTNAGSAIVQGQVSGGLVVGI